MMPPCLILCIIRYWSRVKWINPRNVVAPPRHFGVVAIEKGAFGSPSTKVVNFTLTIYIRIFSHFFLYLPLCLPTLFLFPFLSSSFPHIFLSLSLSLTLSLLFLQSLSLFLSFRVGWPCIGYLAIPIVLIIVSFITFIIHIFFSLFQLTLTLPCHADQLHPLLAG